MDDNFTRPEYPDLTREQLVELVPFNTESVLDVGCNQGGFGHALRTQRNVKIVWGVEPDKSSSETASLRLDQVINDFYHEGNPIPDHFFDLITFNDSLEHMIDPSAALKLSLKKLKPGGKIHCCIPNVRHIDNIEHIILEKDWKYMDCGIRDRTHLRFFTKKSIIRLLTDCGYRINKIIDINENWWHKDKKLRRILFKLFPKLTDDMRHIQIAIIAEAMK